MMNISSEIFHHNTPLRSQAEEENRAIDQADVITMILQLIQKVGSEISAQLFQQRGNIQRFRELYTPPTPNSDGVLHIENVDAHLFEIWYHYPARHKEINDLYKKFYALNSNLNNNPSLLHATSHYNKAALAIELLCWDAATFQNSGPRFETDFNKLDLLYKRLWRYYSITSGLSAEEKLYKKKVKINIACRDGNTLPPLCATAVSHVAMPLINLRLPENQSINGKTIATQAQRLSCQFGSTLQLSYFERHALTYRNIINRQYDKLQEKIEKNQKIVTRPGQLLFSEYEIYLLPHPKKFCQCLNILFQALRNDESLRCCLSAVDIAHDHYGSVRPIILYPLFGRIYAQNALQHLCSHFLNTTSLTPRKLPPFSQNVFRGLIAYTQGHAAHKEFLFYENNKLFTQLFDENGVHLQKRFGNFLLHRN